jgi:predicted small lipoprotein YifL
MRTGTWIAMTLTVALMTGCGQSGPAPAQSGKTSDTHDEHAKTEKGGHDHSGWWCNEHGVPEEVCGQCSSKVAAEFQKKGDWCKEHDRPDSQCFKCHPELEAKFAAQYEAKYGKKPPTPEG